MDIVKYVKDISGMDISDLYESTDGKFVANYTHVAGYSRMVLFSNALFFNPHILKQKVVKIPLDKLSVELEENGFLKAIFSGKNSIKIKIKDGAVTKKEFSTGVGQETTFNGVKMHVNNPKCNKVFVKYFNNMLKVLKNNIMSSVNTYAFIKSLHKDPKSGKLKEMKFSWMGPQETLFVLPDRIVVVNEEIKDILKEKVKSITLEEDKKVLGGTLYIKIDINNSESVMVADFQGNKETKKLFNYIKQ